MTTAIVPTHIATAHSLIFSNMGKWKNWGDAISHLAEIGEKQINNELRWILDKAKTEGNYQTFKGRIPYAMAQKLKKAYKACNYIIDGDKVWTISIDWGKYKSNEYCANVIASYENTEDYFNYFA